MCPAWTRLHTTLLAEREGFEPPIGLHLCRISSAVHSTTLPPLQGVPVGRGLRAVPNLVPCSIAFSSEVYSRSREQTLRALTIEDFRDWRQGGTARRETFGGPNRPLKCWPESGGLAGQLRRQHRR